MARAKPKKSPAKPQPISSKKALIPVRALDFVMYNTKEMKATRAFYQKLFGFKRGHEWSEFWSEFDTAPLTFCLNDGTSRAGDPKWDWDGAACVALAVDDVPAAIAKCRKQGVKILIEPVETRVCWMAWIADPAGNRICLHSRKDGSAG
ncbi:MAG: VOC family protein [Verrucomicrobia bacterium]|nr:VOC family protein [Verrucomicrobiota bacterium]